MGFFHKKHYKKNRSDNNPSLGEMMYWRAYCEMHYIWKQKDPQCFELARHFGGVGRYQEARVACYDFFYTDSSLTNDMLMISDFLAVHQQHIHYHERARCTLGQGAPWAGTLGRQAQLQTAVASLHCFKVDRECNCKHIVWPSVAERSREARERFRSSC